MRSAHSAGPMRSASPRTPSRSRSRMRSWTSVRRSAVCSLVIVRLLEVAQGRRRTTGGWRSEVTAEYRIAGALRARHATRSQESRPGYHGPPDDHRPERLHPPPRPLRVQPPRRPRPDHGTGRRGRPARHGFARPHRPRRALRRGRVLPGGEEQGHQAHPRHRDLRRPPIDDRQGGQGRQPALPPDPARPGLDRLPEPVPARDRRPPRRLLLQAPDRPGVPRPAQCRAHRTVGVPERRGRQGPRGRRLGARPQGGRRVRRHPRQGPVLPRAPGPRHARAAAAQRAVDPTRARGRPAARRHQRPALRAPGPVRGPRRAALRRAPATTSTRPTG